MNAREMAQAVNHPCVRTRCPVCGDGREPIEMPTTRLVECVGCGWVRDPEMWKVAE